MNDNGTNPNQSNGEANAKYLLDQITLKNKQIEFLWKLLDDISTAGDMFKPEIIPYFKYINKKCEERSLVANSFDGYTLKVNTLEPTQDKARLMAEDFNGGVS